jgi:5-methylcytosine-specific restriction endonuclease McrA
MHLELGRVEPSTVVDHKVPHKGDYKLFWDPKNHQALCATCHNSHKQRLERSGKVSGCSPDGIPVDPSHHWHKG